MLLSLDNVTYVNLLPCVDPGLWVCQQAPLIFFYPLNNPWILKNKMTFVSLWNHRLLPLILFFSIFINREFSFLHGHVLVADIITIHLFFFAVTFLYNSPTHSIYACFAQFNSAQSLVVWLNFILFFYYMKVTMKLKCVFKSCLCMWCTMLDFMSL